MYKSEWMSLVEAVEAIRERTGECGWMQLKSAWGEGETSIQLRLDDGRWYGHGVNCGFYNGAPNLIVEDFWSFDYKEGYLYMDPEDSSCRINAKNDARLSRRDIDFLWPPQTATQASSGATQQKPEYHNKKPRGRRPGSGSYIRDDMSLADIARAGIESGRWKHGDAAAKYLAKDAVGPGTLTSKYDRLRKRHFWPN